MAFPYIYANGLGYSLGDSLLAQPVLYTSCPVYYVDSSNASASNSNTGLNSNKPLATMAYARTVVPSGSIIILGADHEEAIAATATWTQTNMTIVGAGSSEGDPTAKLTFTSFGLTFSGAGLILRNFIIECDDGPMTDPLLTLSGDNPYIKNVLASVGAGLAADPAIHITTAVTRARVYGLKGVSIADAVGNLPYGILLDQSVTQIDFMACEADAGAFGFGTYAFNFASGTSKYVFIEDLTMLRGADMTCDGSNSGWIGVGSSTGQSVSVI